MDAADWSRVATSTFVSFCRGTSLSDGMQSTRCGLIHANTCITKGLSTTWLSVKRMPYLLHGLGLSGLVLIALFIAVSSAD